MKEYVLAGGIIYHKCGHDFGDKGICDFTTSDEGITNITCRQCGDLKSISEFVSEIANYYVTPAF